MKKLIGTHSGAFHCDEVTACLLLSRYTAEFKGADIRRTRDYKLLDECDIVVDVGGKYQPPKYLDHHQKQFTKTLLDGVRLSSAGLVWHHFPEVTRNLCQKVFEERQSRFKLPQDFGTIHQNIYKKFILSIDANDNGDDRVKSAVRVNHSLWDRVARKVPSWFEPFTDEALDASFRQAMDLVEEELKAQVLGQLSAFWASSLLEQDYLAKSQVHKSGRIIVLKKPLSWKEPIFQLQKKHGEVGKVCYVIYLNQSDGKFRLQCVPESPQSFKSRAPLAKQFMGLMGEQLQKVSGVPDAEFVHATGFIGGAASIEGAIKLAEKSLPKP